MKDTGPGRHRGVRAGDAAALAAYRATSTRSLMIQVVIILAIIVVLVVFLGPYGAIFAPLLGVPFAPYLRGRRLARQRSE